MKPVISFDLDGTLVDSVRDLARAINGALVEVGLPPHDVAAVRTFVGRGARNLALRALEPYGRTDLLDDVLSRFRSGYASSLLQETTVFHGVLDALDALGAHALLAVATNKPGVYARPLVDALLPGRFALVVGPDDAGALKPDALMLRHMEQVLGARVVAHVGDSAVDVETARAHGVPAVGVTWGLGGAADVQAADQVVAHPVDLVDVCLRLLRFPPPASQSA